MNMIELHKATKMFNVSEDYIMHLINKGRVSYATDGTYYIVSHDDIAWHIEQVNYLNMSEKKQFLFKREKMMKEAGLSQAIINTGTAKKIGKTVKELKR